MSAKNFLIYTLVFKTIVNIAIISLILYPTTIYRGKIKTKVANFTYAFDSIDVRPYHHLFCQIPETAAVGNKSVAKEDLWKALNVPDGSILNIDLQTFGACRLKNMTQNAEYCYCNRRLAYIVLLVSCIVFLLVDLVRHCYVIVSKKLGKLPSERCSVCFQFFATVIWSFVIPCAFIFHSFWLDTVYVPDELYDQEYFDKPLTWSLAIYLSPVCWICSGSEYVFLVWCRSEKKETPNKIEKTKKVNDTDKLQDALSITEEHENDTWSVESYSEKVQNRVINWRIVTRLRSKTWP